MVIGAKECSCCRSVAKIMSVAAGVQRSQRPNREIDDRHAITKGFCYGVTVADSCFIRVEYGISSLKADLMARFHRLIE